MADLTSEQIETLNAYGPYNHAVWRSGDVSVTHEERISGRADRLVEVIRKAVTERFTAEQLRSMRILDIGCYDGWLLQQLSDLPFRELVGLEPRRKNIDKGRKVREILGIESRVRFQHGALEEWNDEAFDVVLCVGVLHHLPSLDTAFERLRSICGRLLIVDTLFLSEDCIGRAFRDEIEMKDMVYRYKAPLCGFSGHKFESSYYDGSSNRAAIVSVPSLEALRMYLDHYGFDNVQQLITPSDYREILRPGGRVANAVCLSADVAERAVSSAESDWIAGYERGLLEHRLEADVVFNLQSEFAPADLCPAGKASELSSRITAYIRAPHETAGEILARLESQIHETYQREIVKNLRFNPADKITLESAKQLYHDSQWRSAVHLLQSITCRLNADWRATYRAFFLLSRCFARLGDVTQADRYQRLCQTSNDRFPCQEMSEH